VGRSVEPHGLLRALYPQSVCGKNVHRVYIYAYMEQDPSRKKALAQSAASALENCKVSPEVAALRGEAHELELLQVRIQKIL
jgi:hypothetical protein